MFNPHFRLGAPTGGELRAELGIDPMAVREIADDERATRCPDRGAMYPERSFASLDPEPLPDHGLSEAGPD